MFYGKPLIPIKSYLLLYIKPLQFRFFDNDFILLAYNIDGMPALEAGIAQPFAA